MNRQSGLGDVERNNMIETGLGSLHHRSVHPGVLDCMRPLRPLYRSEGQAKAAQALDRKRSQGPIPDTAARRLRRRMAILRLRPSLPRFRVKSPSTGPPATYNPGYDAGVVPGTRLCLRIAPQPIPILRTPL